QRATIRPICHPSPVAVGLLQSQHAGAGNVPQRVDGVPAGLCVGVRAGAARQHISPGRRALDDAPAVTDTVVVDQNPHVDSPSSLIASSAGAARCAYCNTGTYQVSPPARCVATSCAMRYAVAASDTYLVVAA